MLVCRNCFCESSTLDTKFAKSNHKEDCPTCGSSGVRLLDTDDLVEVFEPLQKMYEVAEHGQHYIWDPEDGVPRFDSECDDLLCLLQNDWQLFADEIDDEVRRVLLGALWAGWDETSAYSSNHLWEEYADSVWERLAHRVKHQRRFFSAVSDYPHEIDDIERHLGFYVDACDQLKPANTWFRARVGKWPVSEMGAPPSELVKRGGRANPAGIAYLYLASHKETALAEVRAEPGDEVTLATFAIHQDTRIADLSDLRHTGIDPFANEDLKSEINRRGLLRRFAETLSRPVNPNDHEIDYVPTQYLAEFFLTRGFDGICFLSSLAAPGTNIVLFDPEKCSKSPDVFHVHVKSKKLSWSAVNSD